MLEIQPETASLGLNFNPSCHSFCRSEAFCERFALMKFEIGLLYNGKTWLSTNIKRRIPKNTIHEIESYLVYSWGYGSPFFLFNVYVYSVEPVNCDHPWDCLILSLILRWSQLPGCFV